MVSVGAISLCPIAYPKALTGSGPGPSGCEMILGSFLKKQKNKKEKTKAIGSLQNSKVPESNTAKIAAGKPDLQFFPEGGTLVAAGRSQIAFKAIDQNGMGIPVKGVVLV